MEYSGNPRAGNTDHEVQRAVGSPLDRGTQVGLLMFQSNGGQQ